LTFEEWFEANRDARLQAIPVENPDDEELCRLLAICWNAALEAAEKHSYPMAQLIASRAVAVDELEDMKVKL